MRYYEHMQFKRGIILSLIGFFALIYGWFILENYGFHFDGLIAVILGLFLMTYKELFAYLKGRQYVK